MTVITTIISRFGVVHATDSLVTELQSDGTRKVTEWRKSKIVPVKHYRGIMSYYGLAKCGSWNTYDWLKAKAANARKYKSPERFVRALQKDLNRELKAIPVRDPKDKGIGIHFSAYERISDYWIPELFYLTNFETAQYKSLAPDGVHLGRETYHTIVNVPASLKHRLKRCRLVVHDFLNTKRNILIYNNGDPIMFNAAANSIMNMFQTVAQRGQLKKSVNLNTYLKVGRRSVELVSEAQQYFCRKGSRTVGGKPHELGVTPNRQYYTTHGRAKI